MTAPAATAGDGRSPRGTRSTSPVNCSGTSSSPASRRRTASASRNWPDTRIRRSARMPRPPSTWLGSTQDWDREDGVADGIFRQEQIRHRRGTRDRRARERRRWGPIYECGRNRPLSFESAVINAFSTPFFKVFDHGLYPFPLGSRPEYLGGGSIPDPRDLRQYEVFQERLERSLLVVAQQYRRQMADMGCRSIRAVRPADRARPFRCPSASENPQSAR